MQGNDRLGSEADISSPADDRPARTSAYGHKRIFAVVRAHSNWPNSTNRYTSPANPASTATAMMVAQLVRVL